MHEHTDLFIAHPLQILLIIVLALVLRAVLHRAIDRLTRPTKIGRVPRILNPLKEKAVSAGSRLESRILPSERRRQRADTIASVLKNAVSLTPFVIAVLTILPILGIDLTPVLARSWPGRQSSVWRWRSVLRTWCRTSSPACS